MQGSKASWTRLQSSMMLGYSRVRRRRSSSISGPPERIIDHMRYAAFTAYPAAS